MGPLLRQCRHRDGHDGDGSLPHLLRRGAGHPRPAARNLWTGLVVGAAPVVAALMGPVWGAMSDRTGRKVMVLRALAAIVVFVGIMGLAPNVWVLLAMRILQGFFSGYIPTAITFASVLAPEAEQGRIASRIQSAMPAGMVGGYLIGGFMSEAGLIRYIFPLCAGLALLGVIAVALFTHEPEVEEPRRTKERVPFFLAMRQVLGLPSLAALLGAIAMVRFLVSTVDPVYARYVEEVGGTKDVAGMVMSAQALTAVVFMQLWGHAADRIGPSLTFVLSGAGTALSFWWQGHAGGIPELFVARCTAGACLSGVFPAAYILAGREAPSALRGAAMGVVFMIVALSHALGSLAGGGLLNLLGFRGLFVVISSVVLTLSGVGLILRRRHGLRGARARS
ncbi:MAG: MFS transporter [Planctomycetota bacterium]